MTDAASTTFVYVTYNRTTPEQLWSALTSPDLMKKYWFDMHQESDWKAVSSVGRPYSHSNVLISLNSLI